MDDVHDREYTMNKKRQGRRIQNFGFAIDNIKTIFAEMLFLAKEKAFPPFKGKDLWWLLFFRVTRNAIDCRFKQRTIKVDKFMRGHWHQYNNRVDYSELKALWRFFGVWDYDGWARKLKLYWPGHQYWMEKLSVYFWFWFSLILILCTNIVGLIPIFYFMFFFIILGLLTETLMCFIFICCFIFYMALQSWIYYYISLVFILHCIILSTNRLVYKTNINVILNLILYFGFIRPQKNIKKLKRHLRKKWYIKIWGQIIFDLLYNEKCAGPIIDFCSWMWFLWKQHIERNIIILLSFVTIILIISLHNFILSLDISLWIFDLELLNMKWWVFWWFSWNVWLVIFKWTTALIRHNLQRDKLGRPSSKFWIVGLYYLTISLIIYYLSYYVFIYNIEVDWYVFSIFFYYWIIWGFLRWFQKWHNWAGYRYYYKTNFLINPYILIIYYIIIINCLL